MCNQLPTHLIHKRVMTSRSACIIQSLCGVTSNRTGPGLNPGEETERPFPPIFLEVGTAL